MYFYKSMFRKIYKFKNGKIVVEPVADILQMAGSLADKAFRGQKIDIILKKEKKAVAEAVAERYRKK